MPTPNSQHIFDGASSSVSTNTSTSASSTATAVTAEIIHGPKEIVIGDKFKVSTLEYSGNLKTLYGQTIKNAANSIVFVKHNNAYTLWIVDKDSRIFPVQFYDATSLINNYTASLPTDTTHIKV